MTKAFPPRCGLPHSDPYRPCGVVGCDIAADERARFEDLTRRREFAEVFQIIEKLGLHRTVHAGEGCMWR